MFEQTKALCQHFLDLGIPGFDLIVYKDGECVLRHMGGYADPDNKIPMSGKERYHIYSCSKLVTCVAAMQLWEKGLFSLDDNLSDYLPAFAEMTVKTEDGIKKAENPILIRHLFEMTAGLSYNCRSPQIVSAMSETDGRCPTRETMKYLAKEPLLFEPGDRWEYSLCHDVLAALVEVISGEKFEVYVKKNIFDVAGMDRSTFMLPESEIDTITERYCFNNETKTAQNCGKHIGGFKLGSEYASGGAGCISCLDDYILFAEMLTHKGVAPNGNRILSERSIDLMRADCLDEKTRPDFNWDAFRGYGYGFGVRTFVSPAKGGSLTSLGDFGWGGAAGAYVHADPERELSIVYIQHMLNSQEPIVHTRLRNLIYAALEY